MADRSEEARGTPRIYALIEHVPKDSPGKSPSIWAWPQVVGMFKVAGQPVPGPWPPHQEMRPDPEAESTPVAVPEQRSRPVGRSAAQPSQPAQHGLRGADQGSQSEQQGSQSEQQGSQSEQQAPERGRSVSLPRRPGSSQPS